jgi:epoxyqueuosine reductase
VALRLPDPPETAQGDLRGKLARFARYPSYQEVLGQKLEAIADALGRARGGPVATRICVDSAPLLERPLARRAGLGFVADSALLVVPGQGTEVVLGELLVDLELEVDAPDERRCRGCGACRKTCPTGALVGPGLVEARRCVSYLTQRPGIVPRELRAGIGQWVFGCDLCQSVCPENHSQRGSGAADGASSPSLPNLADPSLVDLAWAKGATFRGLVGESRLGEASPRVLARNAAIALGNSGDDRALRPLAQIAREHPSPNVRLHAAWALGSWPEGRPVLDAVLANDPDPAVRDEAEARLEAS